MFQKRVQIEYKIEKETELIERQNSNIREIDKRYRCGNSEKNIWKSKRLRIDAKHNYERETILYLHSSTFTT